MELSKQHQSILNGSRETVTILYRWLEDEVKKDKEDLEKINPITMKTEFFTKMGKDAVRNKMSQYQGKQKLLKDFDKIFGQYLINL